MLELARNFVAICRAASTRRRSAISPERWPTTIWATLSTRQSRTRPPPPDQPRCAGWCNPRGLSADEECRVQGLPRAEVAPIHAVGQPQADRQRPTFQHHHDGGWTVDQGVGSRAPPAAAAADWFTPSKAAARSLGAVPGADNLPGHPNSHRRHHGRPRSALFVVSGSRPILGGQIGTLPCWRLSAVAADQGELERISAKAACARARGAGSRHSGTGVARRMGMLSPPAGSAFAGGSTTGASASEAVVPASRSAFFSSLGGPSTILGGAPVLVSWASAPFARSSARLLRCGDGLGGDGRPPSAAVQASARTGAASARKRQRFRGDADRCLSFFPRRRVTGLGYGAQYQRAVDEFRREAGVPAVQAGVPGAAPTGSISQPS